MLTEDGGKILEQALGNDAGLDVDVIGVDLAFDLVPVIR
jgi:hypothetical protein